MDSIDIGETAADFVAASTFDGARHGFVFRMGDRGIGYYRDDGATKKAHARSSQQPQSQQSTLPVMPPPPPRPPPPSLPPRPLPAQPAAGQPAQPASTSFWQQLEEFTQELDGGGGSSAVSEALAHPQPRPLTPPRAPSPPACLPSTGATQIIHWRPHRRYRQQRSRRVLYTWPAAPHITQAAQDAQAQSQVHIQVQVQAQAQAQAHMQQPAARELQVGATLTEWTEGTVPGSREWIQALRAHAQPPTGWVAEWTNL